MNKARPLSIYTGHPTKRPREDTLFCVWLQAHGISKNKAAKLIGCAERMIEIWCWGQAIPGLLYAYKIEQITQGGVPTESWLGTSLGKWLWQVQEKKVKIHAA